MRARARHEDDVRDVHDASRARFLPLLFRAENFELHQLLGGSVKVTLR
jgi:hypothetical protein